MIPKFFRKISIDDFTLNTQNEIRNFTCSICGFIILNPVCDQNSHLFCNECVIEYITNEIPCPVSNTCHLSLESISEVPIITNILMSKEIKCLNEIKGCNWIGFFSLLSNHLSSQCLKQDVQCTYLVNGCDVTLLREKANEHVINCPYRTIKCKNKCSLDEVIIFKEEQQHLDQCPNEVIDCVNDCGVRFERKDFDEHSAICDMARFPCAYEPYGCNEKVLNADKTNHMSFFEHKHNSLVLGYSNKTKNEISIKTELIQGMQKELNGKIDKCYKLMMKLYVYDNEAKWKEDKVLNIEDINKDKDNDIYKDKDNKAMMYLKNKTERAKNEIGIDNIEEYDKVLINKRKKLAEKLSFTLFS